MTYDPDQIQLGRTGALWAAPLGTPEPDIAVQAGMGPWADGTIDLGFISTDGVTEEMNEEREDVRVWQSSSAVKEWIKSREFTFGVKLMEVSLDTLSVFYGVPISEMVIDETSGTVEWTDGGSPMDDVRFFGIDVMSQENDLTDNVNPSDLWHNRIIIPRGSVRDRESVQYSRENGTVSFGFKIKATVNAQGWSVKRRHLGLVLPTPVS